MSNTPTHKAMSTQQGLDTGKPKASPSWLQRMAANLGFASAPSLRETLESAIGETGAEEDKSLSPQERAMLLNVLGFGETRVAEVMIPRADIVAIEDIRPIAELFALFAKAGHSRVPVFHESLDNPLGMVHIKDAMAWATQNAAGKDARRAAARIRGVYREPGLRQRQAEHAHRRNGPYPRGSLRAAVDARAHAACKDESEENSSCPRRRRVRRHGRACHLRRLGRGHHRRHRG